MLDCCVEVGRYWRKIELDMGIIFSKLAAWAGLRKKPQTLEGQQVGFNRSGIAWMPEEFSGIKA
jgi:hypothetical protein